MLSPYISHRYVHCFNKAIEDALSEYGIDKNTVIQFNFNTGEKIYRFEENHLTMVSYLDHKRPESINAIYRDGCLLFFIIGECPYLLNGKMHADFRLVNQFNECIKRFSYDL